MQQGPETGGAFGGANPSAGHEPPGVRGVGAAGEPGLGGSLVLSGAAPADARAPGLRPCAWCGVELDVRAHRLSRSGLASHGLCRACARELLASATL
jgi:hypothetical protein